MLSAVEGLEVVSPLLHEYVIPATLVILFMLEKYRDQGWRDIARFFGPITLVWFSVIAVLGISHIAHDPQILLAISPHYALAFIVDNPLVSFIILGAVVLCVTGATHLYAELGHFG